jgi:hypothetical protein
VEGCPRPGHRASTFFIRGSTLGEIVEFPGRGRREKASLLLYRRLIELFPLRECDARELLQLDDDAFLEECWDRIGDVFIPPANIEWPEPA